MRVAALAVILSLVASTTDAATFKGRHIDVEDRSRYAGEVEEGARRWGPCVVGIRVQRYSYGTIAGDPCPMQSGKVTVCSGDYGPNKPAAWTNSVVRRGRIVASTIQINDDRFLDADEWVVTRVVEHELAHAGWQAPHNQRSTSVMFDGPGSFVQYPDALDIQFCNEAWR